MASNNNMRSTIKYTSWLFALFLLYVCVVLIHGTFTDYVPEPLIELDQKADAPLLKDATFSFLIWNIGYGGLGAEADFFYHGSGFFLAGDNMVRPSRQLVDKYTNGALQSILAHKTDFILLQEVDRNSKRSYYHDQHQLISEKLPNYHHSFAPNLKVSRNPAPILQPWNAYGACLSGLSTFSKYTPKQSLRLQLPGQFSWPEKPFLLDRCLSVSRYPLPQQKELVVINVHNSAFDKTGNIKQQQLDFLKTLLLTEYEKGNYIVAGGDWNQCPPFFAFDSFISGKNSGYSQINIEQDYLPADWNWIYDPTTPTNRKNKDAYVPGKTFITLIDFFLVSPNVKVKTVKGIDLGFAFSDHQPVRMEIELVQ